MLQSMKRQLKAENIGCVIANVEKMIFLLKKVVCYMERKNLVDVKTKGMQRKNI